MVRIITALIAALALSTSGLNSQQIPTTIDLDFRVFGVGNDNFEGLYYFDGQAYKALDFHKVSRSTATYAYKGVLNFGLYIKNSEYIPTNQNSKQYSRVASENVPININIGLWVIHANPQNNSPTQTKRKFELYFINDEKSHFVRNSILIVNATGRELMGRVGTTNISLPSGISKPISYPENPRGKITRLAFALQTEQGARLVMSNDIQLSNNRRIVIVLMPPSDPNSMRIGMRKLSQSIYEEEVAPE